MSARLITILISAAALAACQTGLEPVNLSAPTPAGYKEAEGWTLAQPSDAADRLDWWTVFNDPVLNNLEKRVEVSNQNLAAAEAAYRQARAMVSEQRAALFPTVDLNGSASLSGSGRSSRGGGSSAGGSGGGGTSQQYRVSLGATWEPDLWGRVRDAVSAASAQAQASAADLANARLSAQTELADDYIQLRQLDEQKRLLDATVEAYAKSLTVTQNRYNAGVAQRSDVLSAQTQLTNTRADATDLAQQRATAEHAIAVLTGAAPADLTLTPAPWTLTPPDIPAGIPSTLLQRRPDIAAAERLAAAANAQIGVQRAAYFPSLDLTGSAGFASSELGKLFSASSSLWSLGASIAETVFDAGARKSRVVQARAARDEAVAKYRQTVLTAFGQVEDSLAAERVLAAEQADRQAAQAAADQNETIALNRYNAGQTDYTSVVVAQASALSARTAVLRLQASRLTTSVDLIGALGGGWRAETGLAEPPSTSSQTQRTQ